jgi:hypothetical protein
VAKNFVISAVALKFGGDFLLCVLSIVEKSFSLLLYLHAQHVSALGNCLETLLHPYMYTGII